MNTTTRSGKTLDRDEMEREFHLWLIDLDNRLEKVELALTGKLNEAYQQGVTDERKARTGRDPKVAEDA